MTQSQLPDWFAEQCDSIAATVVWSPDKREAVVVHPLGASHENVIATCERLRDRGVRVLAWSGGND